MNFNTFFMLLFVVCKSNIAFIYQAETTTPARLIVAETSPAAVPSYLQQVITEDGNARAEENAKNCVNIFFAYARVNGMCRAFADGVGVDTLGNYVCEERLWREQLEGELRLKVFTDCAVGEPCSFQKRQLVVERGKCVTVGDRVRPACLSFRVLDPFNDQCDD